MDLKLTLLGNYIYIYIFAVGNGYRCCSFFLFSFFLKKNTKLLNSSSTRTAEDNRNNGFIVTTRARMHGRKHEKWLVPVEQARAAMALYNWSDLLSGSTFVPRVQWTG